MLHQPAAGKDVDGLQATTDAKDRHSALGGGAKGFLVEDVAPWVDHRPRVTGLAVAGRIDVLAAAQHEAVHGFERGATLRLGSALVERDGFTAVPLDRLEIALVLVLGQGDVGLALRIGERDGDPRSIHEPMVRPALRRR